MSLVAGRTTLLVRWIWCSLAGVDGASHIPLMGVLSSSHLLRGRVAFQSRTKRILCERNPPVPEPPVPEVVQFRFTLPFFMEGQAERLGRK